MQIRRRFSVQLAQLVSQVAPLAFLSFLSFFPSFRSDGPPTRQTNGPSELTDGRPNKRWKLELNGDPIERSGARIDQAPPAAAAAAASVSASGRRLGLLF